MSLEDHLRALVGGGRKILAPYLMCGHPSPEAFPDLLAGVVDAGADLLEIGVPYSDPLMDGPVIQRAADVVLRAEVRPPTALRTMQGLRAGVPFVYMTYVNPILAAGEREWAAQAAGSGAAGVIVPDLPVDEASSWLEAARGQRLAPVFIAGPTTPAERVADIVREGEGFVYCASLLGVTGVRRSLSERARGVVERVREVSDRPCLVGIGVSTPEHAVEACGFADGVIVGSAVVGAAADDGVDAAVALVKRMRQALDG